MAAPNPVPKLYQSVIDDVVANVRESFLDDGVDEQVLHELKQLWENKLSQSKAVENKQVLKQETKQMTGLYAQQQQILQQQQQLKQQQVKQQQPPQPQRIQQPHAAAATVSAAPVTIRAPQQQLHLQQQHQQHQQQQRATVVAQQQQRATVVAQQPQVSQARGPQMEVQLPMFNQATGQFEVSGAAATAQNALGGIYPGSTVTLQTPNGPMQFIIQAPTQQQQQQQQGTVTLPAGTVTTQVKGGMGQVDGQNDSSSDDDDDDDDDNDDDDDKDDDAEENQGEEEEPLNSGDDVSDEDQTELFDTDNVVVCQFDKINRAKNKWKFYLKDGIMNLNGTDYVFQKCNGDAEW